MPLNDHQWNDLTAKCNNAESAICSIRFNVPTPPQILYWLSTIDLAPIVYISNPQQTIQWAAFGVWTRYSLDTAHDFLLSQTDTGLRLFGASSFSIDACESTPFINQNADSEWSNCPSNYWILPHCWLQTTQNSSVLTIIINQLNRTNKDCLNIIQQTLTLLSKSYQHNDTPIQKHHPSSHQIYNNISFKPQQSEWISQVNATKSAIKSDAIKKAVLARKTTYVFESSVSPFMLLHHIQQDDNRVYNFCIKRNPTFSFIGGTPERLFEITDNRIESDAIAGTRFKTPKIPISTIKKELKLSQKDQTEHQWVVDFIQTCFSSLCASFNQGAHSIIEVKYLLHLFVPFCGILKRNNDWLTCLKKLHPTPAVAGSPKLAASAHIMRHESIDRGWYAGPIGFISTKHTMLLVAIRSGTVINNTVNLYSGAGIVKDSDPISEWNELNAKINLFTQLFGGRK